MFIELIKYVDYNNTERSKMLIPINSIITLEERTDRCLVYVRGLQLYVTDYYEEHKYKYAPEYLDTEVIEVQNKYEELAFLLRMHTKDTNETSNSNQESQCSTSISKDTNN